MLKDFNLSKDIGIEDIDLHNDIYILTIADDLYNRGIWEKKLIMADWDKVIEMSIEGLKKSKDLTLMMRLIEGITHKYNIKGLLDIMPKLYELLLDNYYPVEEDYRDRLIQWFDSKLPFIMFYDGYFDQLERENIIDETILDLNNLINYLGTLNITTENFIKIANQVLSRFNNIKFKKHETEEIVEGSFEDLEDLEDNSINIEKIKKIKNKK